MRINFSKKRIEELARDRDDRLSGNLDEERELMRRMLAAGERKHMTLSDLTAVATWKWRGGRIRRLCQENSDAEVREITAVSFAADSERLRIGALLALRGVQWPMASVIQHFAFPDRYPILDVRAMKAVGGCTKYSLESWVEYVTLCRSAAERHGISMRTLDKALWQAGKDMS